MNVAGTRTSLLRSVIATTVWGQNIRTMIATAGNRARPPQEQRRLPRPLGGVVVGGLGTSVRGGGRSGRLGA